MLSSQRRLHLLGVFAERVRRNQRLQLLEPGQPVADRAEVGERAAEPTVADIGHATAGRLAGHRLGALPLRSHEEHEAAGGGDLFEILAGPEQAADRLADVDDVDQVAAAVDVGPHLRVPAAGPVAEMDACFDQFLGQDIRHVRELSREGKGSVRREHRRLSAFFQPCQRCPTGARAEKRFAARFPGTCLETVASHELDSDR